LEEDAALRPLPLFGRLILVAIVTELVTLKQKKELRLIFYHSFCIFFRLHRAIPRCADLNVKQASP
jgi:hypothetical protein